MSVRTLSRTLIAAGAAGVLLLGLAPPASAGQVFHERFRDVGSEVLDDFCGIDGVVNTFDVHGVARAGTRGDLAAPYLLESVHGDEAFINPDTGKAMTHRFNLVLRDHRIIDNGDGTLTIVSTVTGRETWSGAEGTVLRSIGTLRYSFLVDHAGTPGDPEDDVFLEDLGLVMPRTAHDETAGRDFCEDFLAFTA